MATIQTSCTARNLIGFGLCSLLAVACGSSNANKDTGVASDGPNWNDVTIPDVTIPKVDKEQIGNAIFDACWGDKFFPASRTLDQHIAKLRKKIEIDPSNPVLIRTVHGVGYRYDGG